MKMQTPFGEEAIKIREQELLLIDKPLGWTSFDVIKKVRGLLKVKKVGHAGTLDPLASGLLLLGIGKGTKLLAKHQNLDKTYEGTLCLGKTTPSFDLETPFDSEKSYDHLKDSDLFAAREVFLGEQVQRPPLYSACKVKGVKAYTMARKGEKVLLAKRTVFIHDFDLTQIAWPFVDFTVVSSKGTYIRSLAHDFGQHLGVGAHLSALRRTHIGSSYKIEDAYTIAYLEKLFRKNIIKG